MLAPFKKQAPLAPNMQVPQENINTETPSAPPPPYASLEEENAENVASKFKKPNASKLRNL